MRRSIHSFDHQSDEQLMQALATGKEAAFAELYRRHGTRFLRYFFRLLNGDEGRAQDLLQDWCMRVVDNASRFDPRQRFLTWAYTIAGNLVKNEYRSRSVRSGMELTDDFSRIAPPAEAFHDGLDQQAFRQALQQALAERLSDAHREVFLLRYQEECSIKEIAAIVACSEGTVKSRLFYALRNLADALVAFHPCPESLANDPNES